VIARLATSLRRQPRGLLTVAGLGAIAALAVGDYFAPPDVSFLIFYVAPVLFLVWFVGRRAGLLGAIASASFWAWEDVFSAHAYPSATIADWNVVVRLLFMVAFVLVVAELKGALERERQLAAERLEREISIAREVQARLFPRTPPRTAALDCDGVCRPARGVAGDYYDFLELDRGHVGIALGDVAGKGISAALLMASLQGALRRHASLSDEGPAEAAAAINVQIHALTDSNRFATFFWAVFDEASRILTWVNAGHNAPMLLRRSGTVERLTSSGPALGVVAGARYAQRTAVLSAGDAILLFSDGVSEAPSPGGEEFGEARLERVFRDHADAPAREISAAILAAVEAFQAGAPPEDDMTLVVARVR